MLEANEKTLSEFLGEKSTPAVGTASNPEVMKGNTLNQISSGLDSTDRALSQIEAIARHVDSIVDKVMNGINSASMQRKEQMGQPAGAPRKILSVPEQIGNAPSEKIYDAIIAGLENIVKNKPEATVKELLNEQRDNKDFMVTKISEVIKNAQNRQS